MLHTLDPCGSSCTVTFFINSHLLTLFLMQLLLCYCLIVVIPVAYFVQTAYLYLAISRSQYNPQHHSGFRLSPIGTQSCTLIFYIVFHHNYPAQMSWRPLKVGLPLRQSRSLSPTKPSALRPLRTSHDVKKAFSRRQNTVATPAGVYTFQDRGRSSIPVSSTSTIQSSTNPTQTAGQTPSSPSSRSSGLLNVPSPEHGWSSSFSEPYLPPIPTTILKVSRSKKQWIKWTTDVIPGLVRPYLYLMRVTDSLRHLYHDQEIVCTCGGAQRRQLTVTCLYFDGNVCTPF